MGALLLPSQPVTLSVASCCLECLEATRETLLPCFLLRFAALDHHCMLSSFCESFRPCMNAVASRNDPERSRRSVCRQTSFGEKKYCTVSSKIFSSGMATILGVASTAAIYK